MRSIIKKILGDKLSQKLRKLRLRGHFFSLPDERIFLFNELEHYSREIPEGSLVLDIGAGEKPYADLFEKVIYQTSDMEDAFHKGEKHDFYCSIYELPQETSEYDRVFMFQVLEHLEFPLEGLLEVSRILKPGGELFLSVPQGAGDHFEPYHFFNYTRYGLKSVLERSGFEVKVNKRLSGIFTYTSNRLGKLSSMLGSQYSNNYFALLIFFPIRIFVVIFAWILSKMNFLDKKQHYCIGHVLVATKLES